MSRQTARKREKVSITVNPALLAAVDLYVQRHEGLDRSKVMERALTSWYGARQQEAMLDQFGSPESTEVEAERHVWKRFRRSGTERRARQSRS
jgi:hypothetical protein